MSAPVASPCIRICQIDTASGLCIGCLRSLDEIARWGGLSDDARRAIMATLPARAEALGARGPVTCRENGGEPRPRRSPT